MATFDVFVEGPAESGPEARTRLIRLMAQRYGLTEADLSARMERGRFRVKANVDEATSKRYVQELAAIGASVVVVPSGSGPRPTAPPLQTPPAGIPVQQPPPAVARTTTPPAIARTTTPPAVARTTTPPPRAQTQPSGLAVLGDRASSPSVPPRATPPAGLAVLGDRASQPSTPPRPSTPPSGLAVLGERAGTPSVPPTPPAGLAVLGTPTVPTRAATEPPVRAAPMTAPPSALPPRPTSEPGTPAASGQFSSGLAAAFSGEMPAAGGLGALDGEALSLSSLDGTEEAAPGSAFDLPSNPLPASIGPAALPASIGPAALPQPAAPAKPASSGPVDLFAPPDAAAELKFDLAADEIADRERRRSQPLPVASDPTAQGAAPSSPLLKKRAQTPLPMPVAGVVAKEEPRWRFAAGVLLAVVLGFVPAHIVASAREDSAYEKVDEHVLEVQAMVAQPETPIPYAKLDAFRDEAIGRKKSAQRNIALLSLAIWAACSAGLGYVWFRRIPWDKLGK